MSVKATLTAIATIEAAISGKNAKRCFESDILEILQGNARGAFNQA
jgi:hypothetical protein